LIQMNRFRIKFHRINHIFISHLHGDHYLGLMGLLSTMHLQGRTIPIHLYGPADLKEIIDIQLKYSQTDLRYEIEFHPVDPASPKLIYENDELQVHTIVLNHRIACTGFLFSEKQKPRKLLKEKLLEYQIPVSAFPDLKEGKDFFTENGTKIPNAELTNEPRMPRTYAFCSDTIYFKQIIPQIKGIDLLYHEATFMNDKVERAAETFHTTAAQAAKIASDARVKKLIIGHFSARYKNLYPLLEEAKAVFENTSLALEGDHFNID